MKLLGGGDVGEVVVNKEGLLRGQPKLGEGKLVDGGVGFEQAHFVAKNDRVTVAEFGHMATLPGGMLLHGVADDGEGEKRPFCSPRKEPALFV